MAAGPLIAPEPGSKFESEFDSIVKRSILPRYLGNPAQITLVVQAAVYLVASQLPRLCARWLWGKHGRLG